MNEYVKAIVVRDHDANVQWLVSDSKVFSAILGGEPEFRTILDNQIAFFTRKNAEAEGDENSCAITNRRGQVVEKFFGITIITGLFNSDPEENRTEPDSLSEDELSFMSDHLIFAEEGEIL